MSALLFTVYMDGLSLSLNDTKTGCSIGVVMVNHLMYADDLVTISPSAKGLQRLLHTCSVYGQTMTLYLIMTKECECICQLKQTFILTPIVGEYVYRNR